MSLDLNTIWFGLVGTLLTGYAILDGFDLGVGGLHLLARGDQERRRVGPRTFLAAELGQTSVTGPLFQSKSGDGG